MAPLFERNYMPLVLFGVAVLGFTTAGVGLFGVRPFTAVVRPFLLVASAYSAVAIITAGQMTELWWGLALDAMFLLMGLTGVYRRLPIGSSHPGLPHRIAIATGAAFLIYVAGAVVLWPVHRGWGTQPDERALSLPGDRADRNPALELQHAVTIDAPPDAVWAWLVQLGQDRAGFYSYDWLERAFGADVHNVTTIRPEWQERHAGDFVRATQPNYLGGVFGKDLGWTVNDVEPGRALVLRNWGAFVLLPASGNQTRFIIRTTIGDPAIPVWMAALDMMTFELPHFIMERKMMLQIKQLAEGSVTASTM
jgi:hypothetical protein